MKTKPQFVTYFKCIVAKHSDNILEEDLGGERVSMVDNWFSIWSIPAVHFYTSTATFQCSKTHTYKYIFMNIKKN